MAGEEAHEPWSTSSDEVGAVIQGWHPDVAALGLKVPASVPLVFPNGDVTGEVDLHPDGSMTAHIWAANFPEHPGWVAAPATFTIDTTEVVVAEELRNVPR